MDSLKLLARLPDQVDFNYGPFDLLAKFFLKADKMARDRGIRLSIRDDMDGLVALNEAESAKGNWHRLFPAFDPRVNGSPPGRSFWMSGFNDAGEIVAAQAARVYDWNDSDLAAEGRALRLMYGEPELHKAPNEEWEFGGSASSVRGIVCFSGSGWVRPDYRGRNMASIMPRISRAHALTKWGTDFTMSIVPMPVVRAGVASTYGYKNIETGVVEHRNSRYKSYEFALVWMDVDYLVDDLDAFVNGRIEA